TIFNRLMNSVPRNSKNPRTSTPPIFPCGPTIQPTTAPITIATRMGVAAMGRDSPPALTRRLSGFCELQPSDEPLLRTPPRRPGHDGWHPALPAALVAAAGRFFPCHLPAARC